LYIKQIILMPRLFNDFDDQERNLILVKTDFLVLKLKIFACSFKHDFYSFHNLNIVRS